MNQTRVFLLIAWLLVATLLWMEWNKEQTAALQTPPAATQTTSANGAVPGAVPSAPTATAAGIPAAPAQAGVPSTDVRDRADEQRGHRHHRHAARDARRRQRSQRRTVEVPQRSEVHRRRQRQALRRRSRALLRSAERLGQQHGRCARSSRTVRARRQRAQRDARRRAERDRGSFHLDRPERRDHPPHVHLPARRLRHRSARRSASTTVLRTGRAMSTASSCATRRRRRPATPIPKPSRSTAPTWYTPGDKYERRKYEDFVDDGTLDKDATGGWIALLQHYFFSCVDSGRPGQVEVLAEHHASMVASRITSCVRSAPASTSRPARKRKRERTCGWVPSS